MSKVKLGVVVASALAAVAISGFAAEPEGWKFEVTPYAWLAGIEGDVTVNGHKAEFDKSFGDLFDAVEVAGSLYGTIQYNRFLLWGQADYFHLSTDQLDADQQPRNGSLDTKMLLSEIAVGYQFDGFMEGQTFDVLLGVRSLHLKTELELNSGSSYEDTRTLVDPILVVRPSVPLFPSKIDGLRLNPTFAVGAGGDSDLVYELFPELQYQASKYVSLRLGYRRVGYKFVGDNNEDNEANLQLAGLIAGVGVTF